MTSDTPESLAPPDPFAGDVTILRALEEVPPRGEVPLPPGLVAALDTTRRTALDRAAAARRRRPLGIGLIVLGLAAAVALLLLPRVGDDFAAPAPMARIIITSPGDLVADPRPTIAWSSKDVPGQRYDVWILPEEGDSLTCPALFTAKGIVSPVSFASLAPAHSGPSVEPPALEPGRGYRVLVCLAGVGRHAGTPAPFRVKP
jgi:hypothetical protein